MAAASRLATAADHLPSTVRTRWEASLAAFQEARAVERAAPMDIAHGDKLVDEVCNAMDRLIEKTDAPDLAALKVKVDLATERAGPFEDVLFDDHARAIVADINRLAEAVPPLVDPHPQWLADRNRLMAIAERRSPMADELMNDLIEAMRIFERRIEGTPAATTEGWAAKAILLLQLPSEGFDASEDQAAAVLQDAAGLLGMGHRGEPTGVKAQAA